jgi:hypothetical protein
MLLTVVDNFAFIIRCISPNITVATSTLLSAVVAVFPFPFESEEFDVACSSSAPVQPEICSSNSQPRKQWLQSSDSLIRSTHVADVCPPVARVRRCCPTSPVLQWNQHCSLLMSEKKLRQRHMV